MASPESKNAEKQSLYADRLIDDQGNQEIRWLIDKDQTCMAPKPPNTAVLVLRRRICGCDKCAPYPKLFAAPPPPSEEDKKWAKAPATVELVRVSLIGGFANATGDRVVYPVEFTHVGTPKVLTLWCKQEHGFFATGSKFEEFIESHRFRSDSPWIKLAFFWADKKAQARRRGDEVAIKPLVWFLEGFDLRPGDKARIILERRRDAAGNFDDIACLPEAISIGRLADFSALNRFFGKPDWEVGDVGLFIEKKKQLAVFRLTKERREEIRKFLDGRERLALGMEISRETALVLVLLLLWFVDKEWGAQLEEFFASPIKFVQEKCNAWKDKQLQGIQKGYEEKIKRTAYGEILGVMTPESRKAWIALRHNGKALLARAAAVMNVLEMIERGALWVAETLRISSFVESVLRPDTLYSSAEEYFLYHFCWTKPRASQTESFARI